MTMAKHGRSFIEARGKVDREHEHQPAEAVKLIKELKRAKFDESVEIHVRTGLTEDARRGGERPSVPRRMSGRAH